MAEQERRTSGARPVDPCPDLRGDKALFKKFLENPYPVRSVTYRSILEGTGKGGPVIVISAGHGALQADTFYQIMYSDGGPAQPASFKKAVSGQSSDGTLWTIDGQAMSGAGGQIQSALPGATAYTRATSRSMSSLLELRYVCWFGLPRLVPGSLEWSGDSFKAAWYSPQWPQDTNICQLNGTVLAFSNNLPVGIRLSSSAWPRSYRYVEVHYHYPAVSTNQFYPTKIWTVATLDSGQARGMSYDEIRIDFGAGNVPKGGYKPEDFLPVTNSARPVFLVASNRGVFWEQGGHLSEVEGPKRQSGPLADPLVVRRVVLALLVLSLFLPGIIVLVRRRCFRTGEKVQKENP